MEALKNWNRNWNFVTKVAVHKVNQLDFFHDELEEEFEDDVESINRCNIIN